MINLTNNTGLFNQSFKNAYGSRSNFEHELIYKAFLNGNKGTIYFCMNKYLNFNINKAPDDNDYILLACNLDICDIYNFIEDIDYSKLEKSYYSTRKLIESNKVVRI